MRRHRSMVTMLALAIALALAPASLEAARIGAERTIHRSP